MNKRFDAQEPLWLGVCLNVSRKTQIPVEIVRIAWILSILCGASAIAFPIYIIIWLVMVKNNPEKNQFSSLNKVSDVVFTVNKPKKATDEGEVIINGVRGEKAIINGVREYRDE